MMGQKAVLDRASERTNVWIGETCGYGIGQALIGFGREHCCRYHTNTWLPLDTGSRQSGIGQYQIGTSMSKQQQWCFKSQSARTSRHSRVVRFE